MKHWLETKSVFDRLASLRAEGTRTVLATVVRVIGSAYRHEGAKLLVAEDGTTTGNVSGGCLEQDVREVALQVIQSGAPQLRTYCSGTDEIEAWNLGLGCEGRVDVWIEPARDPRPRERALLDGREPFVVGTEIGGRGTRDEGRVIVTRAGIEGQLGSAPLASAVAERARELLGTERSQLQDIAGHSVFLDAFLPPPQLVIFGAGDDAQPLARFAAQVGFRVAIVDRRPGNLTASRFPEATQLLNDAAGLGSLTLDGSSYAVVMTHNYADDGAYLRALVPTPVAYIGMLGPRQRTERILQDVSGGKPIDDSRIFGPVGLDIGTDGAEQVALSVIAEILAVRANRRLRSLRERRVAIHAPAD